MWQKVKKITNTQMYHKPFFSLIRLSIEPSILLKTNLKARASMETIYWNFVNSDFFSKLWGSFLNITRHLRGKTKEKNFSYFFFNNSFFFLAESILEMITEFQKKNFVLTKSKNLSPNGLVKLKILRLNLRKLMPMVADK